jgi:hypothetical protein
MPSGSPCGRLDVAAVEKTHSCVRYFNANATWGSSNTTCVSLGRGYRLLTSAQVRLHAVWALLPLMKAVLVASRGVTVPFSFWFGRR